MSEVEDENIDFLDADPTEVTEIFDAETPITDARKLPGYDIGFVNGRNETKVKDWIDGVTQTLGIAKRWLEKQKVPHADQIVAVWRNEIFRKPK